MDDNRRSSTKFNGSKLSVSDAEKTESNCRRNYKHRDQSGEHDSDSGLVHLDVIKEKILTLIV